MFKSYYADNIIYNLFNLALIIFSMITLTLNNYFVSWLCILFSGLLLMLFTQIIIRESESYDSPNFWGVRPYFFFLFVALTNTSLFLTGFTGINLFIYVPLLIYHANQLRKQQAFKKFYFNLWFYESTYNKQLKQLDILKKKDVYTQYLAQRKVTMESNLVKKHKKELLAELIETYEPLFVDELIQLSIIAEKEKSQKKAIEKEMKSKELQIKLKETFSETI